MDKNSLINYLLSKMILSWKGQAVTIEVPYYNIGKELLEDVAQWYRDNGFTVEVLPEAPGISRDAFRFTEVSQEFTEAITL